MENKGFSQSRTYDEYRETP